MGDMERIEARLNAIHDELKTKEANEAPTSPAPPGLLDEDLTTIDNGRSPYQIASSQRNPIPLSIWVDCNRLDLAMKVHKLLHRLRNMSHNPLGWFAH
jgi:hypothetical protein